jgi:hypothetical protein
LKIELAKATTSADLTIKFSGAKRLDRVETSESEARHCSQDIEVELVDEEEEEFEELPEL